MATRHDGSRDFDRNRLELQELNQAVDLAKAAYQEAIQKRLVGVENAIESGMSQVEVSEALGVTRQRIQQILVRRKPTG